MDNKDLGKMEPDDAAPLSLYDQKQPEKHQGDGTNLTRPDVKTDKSKAKTAESLCTLGAGKPYMGTCI